MPISIIIPSYNRAAIIKATLDSILTQSSNEWECIVVDDHSDDNTRCVVEELVNQDSRISYYVNERKKGAQGARNTGLCHAKYEWVVFFDSDNLMHSDFIERMIANIKEGIDVLACCSSKVNIDTGETCGIMDPNCRGDIHDNLFSSNSYVDFNQAVIKKCRILEIGGLDEDCPSMQEWDTHIRLSKIAKYAMIPDRLVDYMVGGKDAISSNKKREVIGRLYILRKHIDEWRARPLALTKFSYQISTLIDNISDSEFAAEKRDELRELVPHLSARVFLCSMKIGVSKIFHR